MELQTNTTTGVHKQFNEVYVSRRPTQTGGDAVERRARVQ